MSTINTITLSLSTAEAIRARSHGEVTAEELVEEGTGQPVPGGLLCPAVFGRTPEERREWFGHVELAAPVVHTWHLWEEPYAVSALLGLDAETVQAIAYADQAVIVAGPEEPERVGQVVSWAEAEQLQREGATRVVLGGSCTPDPPTTRVETGGAALRELLAAVDLEARAAALRAELAHSVRSVPVRALTAENASRRHYEPPTSQPANFADLARRLRVVEAFRASGQDPTQLVLEVLPVLPVELRPLRPSLDDDEIISSDLNGLYRVVLQRNQRLRAVLAAGLPPSAVRQALVLLQLAVDTLFGTRRRAWQERAGHPPAEHSLSEHLRGKSGIFRRSLMGKRVDFSGRSVIVPVPHRDLDECELPVALALELFRPFIMRELLRRGPARDAAAAYRLVDAEHPAALAALEQVVQERPVLLNRAPTLHRLGIQGFRARLVETKAIGLHPLVNVAFNADFDGDQMAVHVPLSAAAVADAEELMLSKNYVLFPANSQPSMAPVQDMVLGCYYLTLLRPDEPGAGRTFDHPTEARRAYELGEIGLHAPITVRDWREGRGGQGKEEETGKLGNWAAKQGKPGCKAGSQPPEPNFLISQFPSATLDTSVGRILFNRVLPYSLEFVNEVIDKRRLADLVTDCHRSLGREETVALLNRLDDLGFRWATRWGGAVSIANLPPTAARVERGQQAAAQVAEIERQRAAGEIDEEERFAQTMQTWFEGFNALAQGCLEQFRTLDDGFNPAYLMVASGARGNPRFLMQLAGARGLFSSWPQRPIDTPIWRNILDGHVPTEYFLTTHSARHGLVDTALRTADAGALMRRIVHAAQDVVVTEVDCGTAEGVPLATLTRPEGTIVDLSERIVGRIAAETVTDAAKQGRVLVAAGDDVTAEQAAALAAAGRTSLVVRSPLTCQARRGVCAKCYGRDPATDELVAPGTAVGMIAAQSIGEPGTQLTMRTFHVTLWGPKQQASQPHPYITGLQALIRVFDAELPLGEDGLPPQAYLDEHGPVATALALIAEAQFIYRQQGVVINDKHYEVVLREMLGTVEVTDPGDTGFYPTQRVSRAALRAENERVAAAGQRPAAVRPLISGVMEAGQSSDSFLAAASSYHTISVLAEVALRRATDDLDGMRENLIIGGLIPAGSGYREGGSGGV